MALHRIQQLVLKIAEEKDISKMSLKAIGQVVNKMDPGVGKTYPQLIKFHMDQLQKKGLLNIDRSKGLIIKNTPGWAKGILQGTKAKLYNIPVYGTASCGPGGVIAEENLEGFVKVSGTLLGRKPEKSFFAIVTEGNSMNRVSFDGKNIEPGDYLIIDKDAPVKDKDIVLAVVEDSGVVKKLVKDPGHDQVLLVSESTEQYPPIVLHKSDSFVVNGKVVQIIKRQK